MPSFPRLTLTPALRGYLAGQGAIVLGAGLSSWTHSLWPLALGASAALMWTGTLVRDLLRKGRPASSPP